MLVIFATTIPLGAWLARIAAGATGRGLHGRMEHAVYRACGIQSAKGMPWLSFSLAVLFIPRGTGGLRGAANAGVASPQSQGFGNVAPLGLQYRHQLCEQYQLAGLWWREHR